MNPPAGSSRWSDDRLDDLALQVQSMRDVPLRVAVMENRLDDMADDMRGCRDGIERLNEARAEERKERKRDFYAMIGAIFAAGMLVIAALGLFLA